MKKKQSIFALLMMLSLITSCNNQNVPTSSDIGQSESVAEVSTTTDTTTTTEAVTTTEFVFPDLTKDEFNESDLEIYHTDFKPSKELEDEIMEYINNYDETCSIYMVNLEDYATFGYNSDTYIATASTIKCPFAFYCYQQIEKGEESFDNTLTYRRGYYSSGTGVLKDHGSGTDYSIRRLLYYMIHYSDNVAFLMLQDHFGYQGYNEMMQSFGFETFLDEHTQWGKLSSHALGYIWTEIYKYKDTCDEGAIFFDTLVNAGSNFLIWPFTDEGYEYKIAHKSGWASPGYHDSGIVLSEHPYVIVIMTDSEGDPKDNSFFYNMAIEMNKLHDEYLEYLGQEPSHTGELPADMYNYLSKYRDGYDEDDEDVFGYFPNGDTQFTTTQEVSTSTTTTITTTTTTTTTTTEPTTTTVTTTTTQEPTTKSTTVSSSTSKSTSKTTTTTEDDYDYDNDNDYEYQVTTVPVTEAPVITYTQPTTVYVDPSQNTNRYQYYDDNNIYF